MTTMAVTETDVAGIPRRETALAWIWALARGLLIGLGLGVAFRAWMRLISTHPEFTWSGTVFILMICTIAGTGASLARTARERWRRRWARGAARTLGTVCVLLVGAGAGMLVLPIWLTAGLAWGRSDWSRWARFALGGVAVLFTVGAVVTISEDFHQLGTVRSVLSVPSLLAVLAVIAMLFSWPTRWRPSQAVSVR